MSVAPAAEQEIVVGVVQGIVQKAADKWQIEVNVGSQNPRRLWTKDAGLVQMMSGMIGQNLSFMCGVSHWTNNQNQPMRSLWVNGYGAPGAEAAPVIQQPQFQPQPVVPQQPAQAWPQQSTTAPPPAAPQGDQRELKIHRQTATKVAVQLLKHLHVEDQTFDNLIRMSERLVHYYDHGVDWPEANGGNPTNPDDDIPF